MSKELESISYQFHFQVSDFFPHFLVFKSFYFLQISNEWRRYFSISGPPLFSVCLIFFLIIFSIRVSCRCGQTNFLLFPQLLDRWLFLFYTRFFLFICLTSSFSWSSFFTLICLSFCLSNCLSIALSTSQSSALDSHSWTPPCPTIFLKNLTKRAKHFL